MSQILRDIESAHMKSDLPRLQIGDTLRVHTRIKEGDKERIQVFEGLLIRKKGGGSRATITVRKVSQGHGVERIFPVHAHTVERIEVKSHGEVRRAKLYYLRNLSGKAARIRERRETAPKS